MIETRKSLNAKCCASDPLLSAVQARPEGNEGHEPRFPKFIALNFSVSRACYRSLSLYFSLSRISLSSPSQPPAPSLGEERTSNGTVSSSQENSLIHKGGGETADESIFLQVLRLLQLGIIFFSVYFSQ